jgi:hypothetical protein
MALNFPNSPALNDIYTDSTSGFSYQWNGTVWISFSAASSSQIKTLDDISASFNNSTQTFALTSGALSISPPTSQSLIINLGGVIQDPTDDYSVAGSNITFSTPPANGLSFSGVALGPAIPVTVVTIPDGTVTDGSLRISTTAVVGSATTFTEDLVVSGDARVTGILTVGTSSITLDGSNNQINVGTGVTVGSSGINVSGIITSTSIVVSAGTTSAPSISPSGDSNTGIFFPSADTIAASTGGTSRITIDSSGRLLLGTSVYVQTNTYSASNLLSVAGTPGVGPQLSTYSDDNFAQGIDFSKSRSATIGTGAVVQSGDALGNLIFNGYDGAAYRQAVSISAAVDGTPGTNDMPGRLVFSTTADGASSPTERLRITSAGLMGLGTSSPTYFLQVKTNTAPNVNKKMLFLEEHTPTSGWSFNIDDNTTGSLFLNKVVTGTESTRITVTNSGAVGINITSPGNPLAISQTVSTTFGNAGTYLGLGGTENTVGQKVLIGFGYKAASGNEYPAVIGYTATSNAGNQNGAIVFGTRDVTTNTAPTERVRIDSSGRLLVGTSSARDTYYAAGISAGINVEGAGSLGGNNRAISLVFGHSAGVDGDPILYLGRTRSDSIGGTAAVQSNDQIGRIAFVGSDGTSMLAAAQIRAEIDGTPGANDIPGRIVLATTADGASSPTERMRIKQGGSIKISNSGSYHDVNTEFHEIRQTTNQPGVVITSTDASFTNNTIHASSTRAANSAFSLVKLETGVFSDIEFDLRGDGNAFADGTWGAGGADYAEYFEWFDSNPGEEDRRGISVVLDGDKIREAQVGEDPIGVISGNPSIVGDAAWNKWNGKYLRDEFGTYIQEDYEVEDEDGNTVIQQRRKLNPAYDPDVEYVSRENRPEWDCVGLMGKLRISKGQVTGSRWIKMRDINDSVEEWLVR